MEEETISLTIFFDGQFWGALFEIFSKKQMVVCKYVFGAEPSDAEVFEFIKSNWKNLSFCLAVKNFQKNKKINPKRMKKIINLALNQKGISKKSFQVIKLQQEQKKIELKQIRKENLVNEEQKKFELRQQKKKQKKCGH
ncbi:MAG: YjdF family protein [Clostridia bacterium]